MRLPAGIRRLFRLDAQRRDVARDVEDELLHYFDEAVETELRAGVGPEEARARARARFGDERVYRRELVRIDGERMRMHERRRRIESLFGTVAAATRGIGRNPWFTVSVVSILTLGIGANAVMFGVVDRLLLSPPQHVVDADAVRIVHIRRVGFNGDVNIGATMTFPDYRDFQSVGAFQAVAGFTEPRPETVGRSESASQARVAGASATLFGLLGVQPEAGRFFTEAEDRIGAEPVAVLAHEYWERERGSDPAVLGSSMDIGQGRFTIVGIAPPGFTGATLEPVDVWVPLQTAQALENGDGWVDNRGWYWVHVASRLAPGATVDAAEAEATAAHRAGRTQSIAEGDYDPNAEVLASPIIAARGPRPGDEARVARWLAGVSLIVLLIACFNVANLLLARAVRARREIAVRLTLGVGRSRLFGELLTESLALAGLGALAATLLARSLGPAVHQALLPDVAFTDTGLSTRLFVFTVVATVIAGLVAGVLPALQATRTELADTLRSGGRSIAGRRSRARTVLLVAQAALSVVLLVGAGLFVRSLDRAEQLDLGFDQNRLAILRLEWNETLPSAERTAIYRGVLDRVRRMPGVRAAGLTYTVPFRSSIALDAPRVPGLDSIPTHHNGGPYANKVGAGYFEAMGLTILEGRGIEASDDGDNAPPVTVVSESMARAIWPGGNAVGSCMIVDDTPESACTEVIGVVENSRRQDLIEDDPHFLYYLNQGHPAFLGPPQSLMVGTTDDPSALLPALRREARAESGQIRFVEGATMREYVEPDLRSWRLGASMFTVFGLLALVVAAWGLYSVLAFDVALRRHEMGVRSALGADRGRIVRLVLRRAMTLVAVGTVVGLALAAGGSRFIEPLLFRVSGTDPATYLLVAGTLLAVAAAAGALPAWRATRVDPREALQSD